MGSKPDENTVVTIEVKAAIPAEDNSSYGNSSPSPRVGLAELDQSLLRTEFFKAKLDRWQRDKEEPVTLEVTAECDVVEGTRLFKTRLEAASNAIANDEAEVIPWSVLDWWKAAENDKIGAFSALVQIFHMVQFEDFAKEVIQVFYIFRLPCSARVTDIASELDNEPIHNFRLLKAVLAKASDNANLGAFKKLAERHLAGVEACNEVMDELLSSYFSFFDWPDALEDDTYEIPVFGEAKAAFSEVDRWFRDHFAAVVMRCPGTIERVAAAVASRFEAMRLYTDPEHDEEDGSEAWPANTLWAEHLLSTCFCALCLETSLHPHRAPKIAAIFLKHGSIFTSSQVYAEDSQCFTPRVDPNFFAISTPEMQEFCLTSRDDSDDLVEQQRRFREQNLKGHAKVVHSQVRHLLLEHISVWTEEDLDFLSETSFPGASKVASRQ